MKDPVLHFHPCYKMKSKYHPQDSVLIHHNTIYGILKIPFSFEGLMLPFCTYPVFSQLPFDILNPPPDPKINLVCQLFHNQPNSMCIACQLVYH